MDDQVIQMTRAELKELLKEAMSETFVTMGVNIADPIEMQKDFQHLRSWRLSVTAVQNKGMLAIILVIITGLMGATLLGIKDMLHGVPPLN